MAMGSHYRLAYCSRRYPRSTGPSHLGLDNIGELARSQCSRSPSSSSSSKRFPWARRVEAVLHQIVYFQAPLPRPTPLGIAPVAVVVIAERRTRRPNSCCPTAEVLAADIDVVAPGASLELPACWPLRSEAYSAKGCTGCLPADAGPWRRRHPASRNSRMRRSSRRWARVSDAPVAARRCAASSCCSMCRTTLAVLNSPALPTHIHGSGLCFKRSVALLCGTRRCDLVAPPPT